MTPKDGLGMLEGATIEVRACARAWTLSFTPALACPSRTACARGPGRAVAAKSVQPALPGTAEPAPLVAVPPLLPAGFGAPAPRRHPAPRPQLYWPDDGLWYRADILQLDVRRRRAKVLYNTGDVEEMDLDEIISDSHLNIVAQ